MWSWRETGSLFALLFFTAILYSSVKDFDFISYDDGTYVAENPMAQQGFTREAITYAFTTSDGGLWAPITRLSHILDFLLFGFWAGGHHLMSLLGHCINTLLVYLLFRRWLEAPFIALFAAALFAWHPQHVESVAWIASRKDILSGMAFLLTLIAYDRYTRKPGILAMSTVTLLFALALLCKPVVITLPCVLLLLDYWPYKRYSNESGQLLRCIRQLTLEKTPLFLLCFCAASITLFAESGGLVSLERLPYNQRISHALISYPAYLGKAFFPIHLAVPYAYDPSAIAPLKVILASILLASVTLFVWWKRKMRSYFLIGWCWFIGMLIPVIGIVAIGHHAMADRFTYLPHLGLLIMILPLLKSIEYNKAMSQGAMVILAMSCLLLSGMQIQHWRTTETLFRHTVTVYPNNAFAHAKLGGTLLLEGRVEESLTYLSRANELEPDNWEIQNDLGVAYLLAREPDKAAATLKPLLEHYPEDTELWVNYGAACYELGDFKKAQQCARQALKLTPQSPQAQTLHQMVLKAQSQN